MRQIATAIGLESGHDPDGSVAAWIWTVGKWTPHRYQDQVYLSFIYAAAEQLAAGDTWPPRPAAHLLKCALFTTV
ncbi:hypothetical protein ABT116_40145 [Streptomyces sp. NPDC002130]|uniref:hypothetical protein n=1 Tax=Streptomyces sp. NPDC002130 TaxID=3155568 RepID=UPI00331F7AE2